MQIHGRSNVGQALRSVVAANRVKQLKESATLTLGRPHGPVDRPSSAQPSLLTVILMGNHKSRSVVVSQMFSAA